MEFLSISPSLFIASRFESTALSRFAKHTDHIKQYK